MMNRNLGNYCILAKLGEGTLGTIYKACDNLQGQTVAIRTIGEIVRWSQNEKLHFFDECKSLTSLRHRNIASVLDVAEDQNTPYIVSELLKGRPLSALAAEKSVATAESRLSIMNQVVEGLQHAHDSGILHRDLKPSNIFLEPDGTIKVLEFGISHLLRPYLARPSVRWGAPIYLSPEQVQGKPYDERSDIFSVGVVFYELFTGTHPFHDKDGNKALDNILFKSCLPSVEGFPDTPPRTWSVISTCLEKAPEKRYSSMADLALACREAQEELNEDVEYMQIELQMALPSLRRAVLAQSSSPNLARLLMGIQDLVNGTQKADYATLNRLMNDLCSHYPAIKAVSAQTGLQAEFPVDSVEDSCKPNTVLRLRTEGFSAPVSIARAPEDSAGDSIPAPPWQPALSHGTGDSSQAPAVTKEECEFLRLPDGPNTAELADHGSSLHPEENEDLNPPLSPGHAAPPPFGGIAGTYLAGQSDAVGGQSEFLPQSDPSAYDDKTSDTNSEGFSTEAGQFGSEGNPIAGEEPGRGTLEIDKLYRMVSRTALTDLARILIRCSLWAAGGVLAMFLLLVVSYKIIGRTGVEVNASKPPSPQGAPPPSAAARAGENQAADVLLRQAKEMADRDRFNDARILIQRILEISPSHQQALAAMEQLDTKMSAKLSQRDTREVKSLLTSASALIRSGNMQRAKAKIDQAEQLHPGLPEIKAIRTLWEDRNAELAQEQAQREATQLETARRQKEEQGWSRQVENLYRRGKYPDALGLLERWLAENPGSSSAHEWQGKTGDAQHVLQDFIQAFNEKRYRDATTALARLEQMNPVDPNVAELRRQVESRKVSARAFLTVYRTGEAASLNLDGQPLGSKGEAENESITIGIHTITVKNKNGLNLTNSYEFSDGQRLSLVYDTAQADLRVMSEADRELVKNRKTMEQVHRLDVEHYHGVFRGSCKGDLLLSGLEVEYRPGSGSHGFRVPFKELKLRIRGKSIELLQASDGKEFQSFKVQEEGAAKRIQELWNKLETLGPGKD
jgi:serine/threonine protein kinase/tetratricopeptide (TPR) repeat protein